MKIIYRNITNEISQANDIARKQGRTILRVELTPLEVAEFKGECEWATLADFSNGIEIYNGTLIKEVINDNQN